MICNSTVMYMISCLQSAIFFYPRALAREYKTHIEKLVKNHITLHLYKSN